MKKWKKYLFAAAIIAIAVLAAYIATGKMRYRNEVEKRIARDVSNGEILFYFGDLEKLVGDEKFENFIIEQCEILLDDEVENTFRGKYYTYVDFINQLEGCHYFDPVIKDYTITKFYSYEDKNIKAELWLDYSEQDNPAFNYYALGLSQEEQAYFKMVFLETHPNYWSTSASSESTTKVKCSVCNGTGSMKFYYGDSTLEAILDGQDDYQYGPCSSCNGTGYVTYSTPAGASGEICPSCGKSVSSLKTKKDASGVNRTWCSSCWSSYDSIMGN